MNIIFLAYSYFLAYFHLGYSYIFDMTCFPILFFIFRAIEKVSVLLYFVGFIAAVLNNGMSQNEP